MGIFFCRSSESSSGGSFFVALAGNLGGCFFVSLAGGCLVSCLLSWPRHVTGVNAAAKTAVSTSARSTVARIIAFPSLPAGRGAPSNAASNALAIAGRLLPAFRASPITITFCSGFASALSASPVAARAR